MQTWVNDFQPDADGKSPSQMCGTAALVLLLLLLLPPFLLLLLTSR
jgi:hypothetical protein